MRYCRFEHQGVAVYGAVDGDTITRLLQWPEDPATVAGFTPGKLSAVRLLSPVQPSKILCVGRNYREHASELGNEVPKEPLIFLKPPSSIIGPGEAIRIPSAELTQRVDFEGELGVVIGKRCRNLGAEEDVRSYIRGYTCVNDVTARDLQKKDGQWARAKGFDTFCPVGPIVTDEIDPWTAVEVTTKLNGEQKQRGHTTEFIFDLAAVIRYISAFCTLEAGDLISTGTPAGVGPMKSGDVVEVTVAGVGTLRNPVQA